MDIFFDSKNSFCLIENILNELPLLHLYFICVSMSSSLEQYSTVLSTSESKVFHYLSLVLRSLFR